ncbi:MAG: restriction endonuclease subunit S, partial [Oscillospiraceae bacterium]|nr:restriction endonuclease subunit S [Oscillospiraceae bacterium]
MKSEWLTTKLGDVCEIVRGGSPRPIMDYVTESSDGVNWLKIGDVSEHDKYFTHSAERIIKAGTAKSREVKKGDLILSNSMSFGRVFITLIDGYIHDGWLRLRNNGDLLDREYLYYFLSSELAQNQFKAVVTGSVVNNLKSDTVKAMNIDIPPLNEQRKIASTLSALDARIAENKKINHHLEQMAQAIWAERFGNYEPNGVLGDIVELFDSKRVPL